MRRAKRHLISDLNITNLVDITLVLLIIFMITAPMMTQGVQVDLPKAESDNVEVNDYIQVSVNARNEIYIDQEKISLLEFGKRFKEVMGGKTKTPVFLNADKRVPYGLVVRVITDIQNAGAVKLGFLTQPLDKTGGI
jgi:biopolymer transport protein TolR